MKLEEVLKPENILSEFKIIWDEDNRELGVCFVDETRDIFIKTQEEEERVKLIDRYDLYDLINNIRFEKVYDLIKFTPFKYKDLDGKRLLINVTENEEGTIVIGTDEQTKKSYVIRLDVNIKNEVNGEYVVKKIDAIEKQDQEKEKNSYIQKLSQKIIKEVNTDEKNK